MTKADLAHAVQRRVPGLTGKESTELVEQVFETMKEMLGRGERVKISGFGTLDLRDKRARRGRNPQTGADLVTVERRVACSSSTKAWCSSRRSTRARASKRPLLEPPSPRRRVEREPLWEP